MTETERRHFQRIIFHRPTLLVANGRSYPGRLLDISLAGALVAIDSNHPLPSISTEGVLDIALSEDPEFMIRLNVRACHAAGMRLGLRTTKLDLDDACRLRRLVELNCEHPELLQREFEELHPPGD